MPLAATDPVAPYLPYPPYPLWSPVTFDPLLAFEASFALRPRKSTKSPQLPSSFFKAMCPLPLMPNGTPTAFAWGIDDPLLTRH